jgi:hypothetical protein
MLPRLEETPRPAPAKRKHPNFFQKKIWIAKKTSPKPRKIPWFKRAGSDENFRETSIIKALGRMFLPLRCFSSRVALTARSPTNARQRCGQKAEMSRNCFYKIEIVVFSPGVSDAYANSPISVIARERSDEAIQTELLKAFVWIASLPLAIGQVHNFVDRASNRKEVQDARQQLRQVYRPC